MPAKAKILDSRDEGSSRCFLSSMSLEDYVNALPSTYRDYDVQREIVSNVYLDDLVETVLNRRHIPPIVLVVEKDAFREKGGMLELKSFKILDGLQRTFRLQAIRKTIEFCLSSLDPKEDYLSWTKFRFSRSFSSQLHEINSNTDVLRKIVHALKQSGKNIVLETFTVNNQWFEIWTGLTPDDEVRKMLMLNAGHKPVKTRHQLELLFLNLLPILREGEGKDFTLVREKEISATQFSKGREPGTFHFAHVITALLSFYEGKPIAPSTGLIQGIQSADTSPDTFMGLAEAESLKAVVSFLVKFDRKLANQYGENGSLWMGREVSLAGLFGAMGSVAENTGRDRMKVMSELYEICRQKPKILNLGEFEDVRNNLDLSKVNIGNVNRSAIFSAIKEVLGSKPPIRLDWKKHFGVEGK